MKLSLIHFWIDVALAVQGHVGKADLTWLSADLGDTVHDGLGGEADVQAIVRGEIAGINVDVGEGEAEVADVGIELGVNALI